MYKKHKQFRLKNFDYSQNGGYFITICTKDRVEYFGKIIESKMHLNEIRKRTQIIWDDIPNKFNNVHSDEFVVMPNHIHGIIIITKNTDNPDNFQERENTEPMINKSEYIHTGIHPLIKNSISSIINHFKGNVKRWCNKNGFEEFNWQARFYDHIIRNEKSLNNIREYIFNNSIKLYQENRNNENYANENIFK